MKDMYYTSIQHFNKVNNVEINKEQDYHEIFDELEKTPYRCGFIALTEERAKTVRLQEEYIINLEDTFYLCVK
jgi:hypothetical protein